ncbi:MAG TPA: NADH-quinone oxidoreductase subunit L [Candidatus Dormibacteraeota bacterium]
MTSTGTLALLVLAFPALGALLHAFFGWRWSRVLTMLLGPGVIWLSFVCVVILFFGQLGDASSKQSTYWTWITSGSFSTPFNLLVDNLSVFMGLVITGVGALIVTYSVGYMEQEDNPSYARFFCYMDLFVFSMLLLVFAGNFVFLVVGWAMVGLSSYLLIGFWYQRPSAVVAARKAFVMNVIGDIGMILAAFLIWVTYHSVVFTEVFGRVGHADSAGLEIIAFLLLVGAVAKSAQLPLHTWLPDAMEGPTPVSALIHAATMVTAGVYLVGRMHPIYDVAVTAHDAVALIGAVTALFAATIAFVQTDIKRVLAYSTMSQIGYMFLAVGVGAYAAGFYHLMSHAFFKALLFMAAGNVIHALSDEQDMRKFGGLWQDLPRTALCFLVGSLSLAGIIPFVGFWSKEVVLGDAFSRGDPFALAMWAIGFVTALLTGFYTGRMFYLTFWVKAAPDRPVEHPHEAPPVMLIPVAILAVLSTIGGFIQINAGFHPGWKLVQDFLNPAVGVLGWEERGLEYLATAATVLLGAFTFFLAYRFYVERRWDPAVVRVRYPWVQTLLERKYWFDEIYDAAFVRPMDWLGAALVRWVERPIIDGAVMGLGTRTENTASDLSVTQSGYFRNYVLVLTTGAVIVLALVMIRGAIG